MEARVIDYDEAADVAVLRIGTPTDKRKPLVLHEPGNEDQGKSVLCIGYPGIADNKAVEASSKWGMDDPQAAWLLFVPAERSTSSFDTLYNLFFFTAIFNHLSL